ncbi:GAF domain-containing protein [Microcoleus sp. FACHB-SPT15]|uniref:GAF domain-containing protein n=1 Tax=Microcoleus sp. FACHB-SPT15 TaxID=2692830 RepID=UPI001780C99A|nr:adenylate/guanylate cyclase domain-containing protein [Microcoleus sp. FACHB-SPT15]MBD1809420.1 GAF domain-containing protein [Microcoleus sp. FACHB-SPT15]
MKAASSRPSGLDYRETIDISVESEDQSGHEQQQSSASALTTTKGTFSAFLAPLTQDTFRQVVTEVEGKLGVVNQTLSMLDSLLDAQGFDAILDEMLRSIAAKTGELLGADRTTIFVKDEDRNELWSIVAKDKGGGSLEIRIPADHGSIAADVATTKQVINIPYDLFDDPRSAGAKEQYERTGYRTYTMLALPLLNEHGDLVAVVQLLNKLKPTLNPNAPLEEKIERNGFTTEDERVFEDFAPSIQLIMESSRSLRRATQRQQAAQALISATNSLSKSSLDLQETLNKVMDEAKQLMNAHRSTLWLIDHDRNDLWTKIPIEGTLKELRLPLDMNSFAGQVALTREPINIGFDLYNHPNSETSKQTDPKTHYRTCSMLCMPVFNADTELIGVTQLINKKKQGEFPEYDPASWPEAPECWRASFNRTDQEFMEAFNIQAGVALQNAKLFDTVKQQEQMQRDILRSLSDGVISTDKEGKIIAVNESAKELLGLDERVRLEGELISEILRIEDKDKKDDNKFVQWFNNALLGKDPRTRQQYYPDQTLLSRGNEQQRSVNLSLNTIADAADNTKVRGALVVMEDISDEKRLKSTMYRYMTQELAEELLRLDDAKLGGDRKEVSILFSDIRSYTALTESLEAEEVVGMLNEYFESMVEAIFKYKGTLDKYIGDAIMAVFGSPLPLKDHAWRAVQTSLEMRYRLLDFNNRRLADNKIPIRIGIGINSDSVISGNIGSSKRMEFTAIGDGVNLGSRLESASKQYGCDIIISESTYKPCANQILVRELDKIVVKGKTQPVSIYELIGLSSDPISDQKQMVIEHYHKGRELYLNRDFAFAIGEFAQVLKFDPNDKPADMHLARCQHWLKTPPPDSWDGAWTLTEK